MFQTIQDRQSQYKPREQIARAQEWEISSTGRTICTQSVQRTPTAPLISETACIHTLQTYLLARWTQFSRHQALFNQPASAILWVTHRYLKVASHQAIQWPLNRKSSLCRRAQNQLVKAQRFWKRNKKVFQTKVLISNRVRQDMRKEIISPW